MAPSGGSLFVNLKKVYRQREGDKVDFLSPFKKLRA